MIYYAHKQKGKEPQTVLEHCTNVAEMAKTWAKPIGFTHTAYLAGFYHDTGKCSAAFQAYLDQQEDKNDPCPAQFKRGDIDHSYAGARYLYEWCDKNNPFDYIAAELLAIVISFHHGTRDLLKLDGEDTFSRRLKKSDYYAEIETACKTEFLQNDELANGFSKARSEIEQAATIITSSFHTNRPFYFGMVARLLLSLVIDADRTDTANYGQGKESLPIPDNAPPWPQLQKQLQKKLDTFKIKGDIDRWRGNISAQCLAFAKNPPGLYQLIVPTGGGKTLASLGYALEHAVVHEKERIFYIAPFNSILEQNCDVFRKIIKDDSLLLEHHCNVEDDSEDYELLAQTWDCPIIATTMVQFLNALFSHKTTAIRRLHRLANAIIIVDEVQAMPLKCVGLFNLAMNFLTKVCGSTIILCSATQPLLDQVEFAPMAFSDPKSILTGIDESFIKFKRTEIKNKTKFSRTYEEAADFIAKKCKKNGNVLAIVNTKKSAATLFDLLRKDRNTAYKIYHLSTNMCPAHRRNILKKIKASLENKEPLICIATQLVEAGVDISFHCVIRSLAGLDNIAQAAGRCNRNGEDEVKYVYVIRLKDESLTRLKEIKDAQDATVAVFCTVPEGQDLLAPKAMDLFYQKYFYEHESEMKYILSKEETNLIDLLGRNGKACQAYEEHYNEKPKHYFHQGFRTAGENFTVIDDNSVGVIVPYNEDAKKIISTLASYCDLNTTKTAQPYTVSLSPNALENMRQKGSIYMPGNSGVWVLDERYYNEDTGLIYEAGFMEPDIMTN